MHTPPSQVFTRHPASQGRRRRSGSEAPPDKLDSGTSVEYLAVGNGWMLGDVSCLCVKLAWATSGRKLRDGGGGGGGCLKQQVCKHVILEK